MTGNLAPDSTLWWELLVALGGGVALAVILAAAADRWIRVAAWQRALWQITTVGLFALVLCELTGAATGLVQLCRETFRIATNSRGAGVSPAGEKTSPCGAGVSPAPEKAGGTPAPQTTIDQGALSTPFVDQGSASTLVRDVEGPIESPADVEPLAAISPPGAWWPAMVWAVGAATIFAWAAWTRVLLFLFRRRCRPAGGEAVQCVGAVAARLGIGRPIRLLVSERLHAPVVFGDVRAVLVLPADFEESFDARQREAILAHELTHLASNDPAWQAASLLACGLLWWHPAAWWSRRRLRAASEAAADEASLAVPGGPCALAEALVRVGRRLVQPRRLAWLSVAGGFRSGLGRRVERLLNLGGRSWRTPGRARLAFAHATLPLAFALIAILGTAWAPLRAPLAEGETTMGVLKTSWRCSLAATALWALLANNPVQAAADDRPADRTPPSAAPAGADRDAMQQQLQALKQKIEQFEKDGNHEEAQRARREAQALMAKFNPRGGEGRTPGPDVSGPDRDKLREQIQAIRQRVEQLEKDGKHEEAEQVKLEGRALLAKLNPRGAEGRTRGEISPRDANRMPSGDMAARLQHLQAAVENLKAAGLDAEAQHFAQLIERAQQSGGRGEGRASADASANPSRGGRQPAGGDVQELRSEVQQMHREMQELREQLKRALDRK